MPSAELRLQFYAHDRYYAVVAVLILLTGLGLVFDGDWSWGSSFIYVGLAAIVLGGVLGGVGLKGLAKKRVDAFEVGDTAYVLVTVLAMVNKSGA